MQVHRPSADDPETFVVWDGGELLNVPHDSAHPYYVSSLNLFKDVETFDPGEAVSEAVRANHLRRKAREKQESVLAHVPSRPPVAPPEKGNE